MTALDSPVPSVQRQWLEKKVDILNQLSLAELDILHKASTRLYKKRGSILWLGGHEDDSETPKVYIVDQGYLRICESSQEGKRHILAMMGPADFFGHITPEVSTLGHPYTLEVVRDARLIIIDAEAFQSVLKNHFNLAMQLIKLMDNRQKYLEKQISSFLFKDVYARLADLLLELAEKYGDACPETGHLELQITHQELSDFLGVARQTVSTIMSEFSSLGLFEKNGQKLRLKRKELLDAVSQHGAAGVKLT